MSNFLISLTSFLVAIAILVAIHEFGHFYVARLCGVKVLRFSLGFGPILFSKRDKYGTEFSLSLLPLGGYVKMLDEREATVAESEAHLAFNRQSVSKRIAIVAAGPLANFLFAIAIFWGIFMVGITGVAPVIGEIIPNSAAFAAQIQPKHEIVAIDGQSTNTWRAVYMALMKHLGDETSLLVTTKDMSSGAEHQYQLGIDATIGQEPTEDILKQLGLIPAKPRVPAKIGTVLKEGAAFQAGLEQGDIVQSVNQQTIDDWFALVELIQQSPNQALQFKVLRAGQLKEIIVYPQAKVIAEDKIIGVIGAQLDAKSFPSDYFRTQRFGPIDALVTGAQQTWRLSVLTVQIAYKMITGKAALAHLSGPISIAQGAGASVQAGFSLYMSFLALISVSLGVINLLPIPVLDGGHLLYYFVEAVIRRPVPESIQNLGFGLGMAFLFCVMGLAIYNDLARLSH